MHPHPTFEDRQLVYVSTKYGLEYIGEYEKSLVYPITLNRARRIHLISIPIPTAEGIRVARNLELGFVSMCEHAIQSMSFSEQDIQFVGIPDKQIADVYMRSVYGLETAPANGGSRILTN